MACLPFVVKLHRADIPAPSVESTVKKKKGKHDENVQKQETMSSYRQFLDEVQKKKNKIKKKTKIHQMNK